MNFTQLWDLQVLVYVVLSALVLLVVLGVVAAMNRRLRCLTSEVESLRRELKLIDEGVQGVAQHLQTAQPGGGTASASHKDAKPKAPNAN